MPDFSSKRMSCWFLRPFAFQRPSDHPCPLLCSIGADNLAGKNSEWRIAILAGRVYVLLADGLEIYKKEGSKYLQRFFARPKKESSPK